jgi:agmatinase
VDPFSVLRVVDYGDAECVPGDLARSHAAISDRVGEVLEMDALPIVLGGDHSIALPHISTVAEAIGKGELGVIQFDTHADTAENVLDAAPHGVPMRRLVEGGFVDPARFVQIGLRGCWPGPDEFRWMGDVGMHWHTMYEIDETGLDAVVSAALAAVGDGPITISLDIDVLDPAQAPGTGTPEPGGLTTRELFRAIRVISSRARVASIEVVEVSPPYDAAGITALAAQRAIVEALVGLATNSR